MGLKIRLARAGAKKRPYYHIVVADSRAPRDGRFIEKVGSYNPMLPADHPDRVRLFAERILHWKAQGRSRRIGWRASSARRGLPRCPPSRSRRSSRCRRRRRRNAPPRRRRAPEPRPMAKAPLVLAGEIGRPHGVRGLVRLRSFTADPAAIASYGPLSDESGTRRFVLEWLGNGLARIEGVEDRDTAARLTGTRLFIPRERLPEPEPDEFYLVDLIGLAAFDEAGAPLGTVRAVEDFGAGAFLTLSDGVEERLIPSLPWRCRWWISPAAVLWCARRWRS